MSTSPIDRSRLDLITGGDEDLLQELVDLFISDCSSRLDEIESALGANNLDKIRRQAHAIKGASANMGASLMQEHAKALEAYAASASLPEIAEAVGHLRDGLATVAREFGR